MVIGREEVHGNLFLMQIILLETFFSGSHRQWALGLQTHSQHSIEIISLPGRFWKWRMHGGANSLAKQVNELQYSPDLFITTDMVDTALFRSLLKSELRYIPIAVYFHENQITYPWSPTDRDVLNDRDRHYGFINYTSALSADQVFFNSEYHRNSFLNALPKFLKAFPDHRNIDTIEIISEKSKTLHLGVDFSKFDSSPKTAEDQRAPTILWNHRWEYDKNPDEFFEVLFALEDGNIPFNLIILGENTSHKPTVFDQADRKLKDRIIHIGYVDSFKEYHRLLQSADYLPVTSFQDFFGISVIEAVYAGVIPILPTRLVYPEHFPIERFPELFYLNKSELYAKLKSILTHANHQFENYKLKEQVEIYNWSHCIRQYDLEFEKVLSA